MYYHPGNVVNKKSTIAFENSPGLYLLLSSNLQIVSFTKHIDDNIDISDFDPDLYFFEVLEELFPDQNQDTWKAIHSAIDLAEQKREAVVLKQLQVYLREKDNQPYSSTCDIDIIPLFKGNSIKNWMIHFNFKRGDKPKSLLQKILKLEKKLFDVTQKEHSLTTSLDYIIKDIEENSSDLSFVTMIAENGNYYHRASAAFSESFINEFNSISNKFTQNKASRDEIESKLFKLMESLGSSHGFNNSWAYILSGADGSFLGILTVFSKIKRELTEEEQQQIQITVNIAIIIIERHKILVENKKNKQILKDISSTFPGVIFQFIRRPDGEQDFTYITEGIKTLYDFELEEIYEDPERIFRQVHPGDIANLRYSLDVSAENLEPWKFEYRVRRRYTNTYRWIRGNAFPQLNEDQSVVWNGTLIDITEAHEGVEKIAESEKRYHFLFEKNPLAMMVVNKDDLGILEINSSAIKVLGFPAEEFLSLTLKDIILKNDFKDLTEKLKHLQKGKDLVLNLKNIRKDGGVIEVEFIITEFQYLKKPAYLKIVTDVTEKRRSEELIKRQNVLFKELFNASPFGIILFDKDEKILQVNKAFEKLFHYEFEEIKNKSIKELIIPDDKLAEAAEILNSARNLNMVQTETRRMRKDGTEFDVLVVRYPIESQDQLLGYYGLYVDISPQKRAERNLKREKDFIDSIINSLPGIIYVIAINGKRQLKLWNENLRKVTEYSDEELAKIKPSDLFIGSDKELIERELHKVSTEGKSDAEAIIISKSGKQTLYYFTGGLAEIEKQSYIIGMGVDLTERSKYQQMLRILERALESLAEGVIITDNTKPDNPIMFVNPEFCRITGYSAEDVIGKNSRLLQDKHTSKKTIAAVKDAVENQRTFRGEILNYSKDGSTFWNLMIIAPVFDKNKVATHFVGMINDISDIKNWQQRIEENNQELKKTNAELDRFVYSTSHDLRAPLTSVLGLINIALAESDPELIRDFLRRMRNSVLRLDLFIQDIVNYSRNTRLEVIEEEINFKELLDDILEKMEFMENANSIDFKIQVKDGGKFYSDKNRLNVILSNLISNGIKYQDFNKEYRYIYIKIKISKDKATITIEDNGQGIPFEYQEKVFHMFFRASEQSTGSGLGLYIVKEMIDKLSGSIKMISNPGLGTKFQLEIPNIKQRAKNEV